MEQREIKFRGKILNSQQWVYGSLIHNENEYYIIQLNSDFYLNEYRDLSISIFFEVDPKTIGQYTGLKDKNGKEIYEGDIVDYKGERPTVTWNILSFGIKYHYEEYAQDFDSFYKELEVIGNIHNNAEML